MNIVVLCGGVGGARFLRGLRGAVGPDDSITAIVNVGDDMWLTGVRIAPDLDSIMYTLAGVNDEERGWGRVGESERVSAELAAYGVGWPWFTLGDLDLGTHLARTHYLRAGVPLSKATELLSARWELGVRLIPATDDEVETYVVTDEGTMHFQEWWTKHRAKLPAQAFEHTDATAASPAPGVLDALRDADLILLAPSNPVVSIGSILAIPGIRAGLVTASAPVVGVSPIIAGAVVRGMADACLTAIGVATSAAAVALHYGARSYDGRLDTRNSTSLWPSSVGQSGLQGLLDGWLVDETDAAAVPLLEAANIRCAAVPLWMRDPESSVQVARDAVALGLEPGLKRGLRL